MLGSPAADNLPRGIALIIFAEAVLVLTGLIIRTLGEQIPLAQLVFLRNAFGLLFILPVAFWAGRQIINFDRIGLHLIRALVGVSAMSCLFYSWTHLPLATAAMLKQTSPLFMPILALWFLGERISPVLRWSLPIGFFGVALVLQPGQTEWQWALLIGLFGAVLGAEVKILVRKMRDTEPARRVVLYFTFFATCISAPFGLNVWVPMDTTEWLGILAIGALSVISQLSMTRAYQSAPAGFLGPFTFSSILIAALLGWLLFEETLGALTLVGMSLILIGGVITVRTRKV